MKNLSITLKFLLLSAFSILSLVAVGIYGLQNVYTTFTDVKQVYATSIKIEQVTREISSPINNVRELSLLMVVAPNHDSRYQLQQQQIDLIQKIDTVLANWQTNSVNFAALVNSWQHYKGLIKYTSEQAMANHREAAFINVSGAEQKQFKHLSDDLTTWLQEKVQYSADVYQAANNTYANTINNAILIIIVFAIILAVFSWFIGSMIIQSLRAAVIIADSIATGKLDNAITVKSTDESGKLMQALASMQQQLRERVDEADATVTRLTATMNVIKKVSDEVQIVSEQISHDNESLSRRTEEQAAFLEQTVASMEQMTSTIQQNANNAEQSTQLAISAREKAERGGSVVNNAILAMQEISSSSKQVADIITVINDIAFQTNLLALNAAVEAARAGEQGRGFAVVATEVRNLAQRSASAAKEIKELIKNSVNKVNEGTKLVNQSGATLEEIVVAVKKVNDIIAEIAAATQEQYMGINQINKAVAKMDDMTQQNTTMVEQAMRSSDNMRVQAAQLRAQLADFQADIAEHDPVVKTQTLDVNKKSISHHQLDASEWAEF
jgi:methyl-accepting chemotaxis protein